MYITKQFLIDWRTMLFVCCEGIYKHIPGIFSLWAHNILEITWNYSNYFKTIFQFLFLKQLNECMYFIVESSFIESWFLYVSLVYMIWSPLTVDFILFAHFFSFFFDFWSFTEPLYYSTLVQILVLLEKEEVGLAKQKRSQSIY